MMIKLYNDDCIKKFAAMPRNEVDAIITDPPYKISRDNNFKTMNRAGIDFGEWDKDFDLVDWIKYCEPVLKKGGNIVIFNSWKNMSYIVDELEKNNFEVKDLIRWEKN